MFYEHWKEFSSKLGQRVGWNMQNVALFRPVEQLCLGCVLHGLPQGDATTCFCTWRFSLDALDCEVIELFNEGCSRE